MVEAVGSVVAVVVSVPVLEADAGEVVTLPEAVAVEEELVVKEELADVDGKSVIVATIVAVEVLSSLFGPKVTSMENEVER